MIISHSKVITSLMLIGFYVAVPARAQETYNLSLSETAKLISNVPSSSADYSLSTISIPLPSGETPNRYEKEHMDYLFRDKAPLTSSAQDGTFIYEGMFLPTEHYISGYYNDGWEKLEVHGKHAHISMQVHPVGYSPDNKETPIPFIKYPEGVSKKAVCTLSWDGYIDPLLDNAGSDIFKEEGDRVYSMLVTVVDKQGVRKIQIVRFYVRGNKIMSSDMFPSLHTECEFRVWNIGGGTRYQHVRWIPYVYEHNPKFGYKSPSNPHRNIAQNYPSRDTSEWSNYIKYPSE